MNELSQSLEQKRQRPFCILTAGQAQFGPSQDEVRAVFIRRAGYRIRKCLNEKS